MLVSQYPLYHFRKGFFAMERVIRRAVITDEFVTFIDDNRVIRRRDLKAIPKTLTDVWNLAMELQVYRLWVFPSSLNGLFMGESNDNYKIKVSYENEGKKEKPRYALVKRNGYEIAIGWCHAWPWHLETTFDLLVTLDYIVQCTGMEPAWSPVYLGRSKFKQKYNATETLRKKIKDPDFDLFTFPFIESASAPYWINPQLKNWVKEDLYLHHIDRNASFPTSSKSVYVGYGELRKVPSTHHLEDNESGVFHVHWNIGESDFDGVKLPLLLREGQEWVTPDQLRMSKNNGYDIELLEGYVWENSSQLFRKWADDLSGYRSDLTNKGKYKYELARQNTLATVKTMSNATIGSFGSTKFAELRRPDWERTIIGKARCTTLNALKKFKHLYPVILVCDDIWLLSNKPDIEDALGEMFEHRSEPGGFKPLRSIAITQTIIDRIQKTSDPITLHTYLKGQSNGAG